MKLTVRHVADDRFVVSIRGHEEVADQPFEAGGGDRGPTPTELFVAGWAGCVGSDRPAATSAVTDFPRTGRPWTATSQCARSARRGSRRWRWR